MIAGRLCITATDTGYFVNKGISYDRDGNPKLNYEAESCIYSSLIELLKDYSPHFKNTIGKQTFLHKPKLEKIDSQNLFTEYHEGAESPEEGSEQDYSEEGTTTSETQQSSQAPRIYSAPTQLQMRSDSETRQESEEFRPRTAPAQKVLH